MSTVAVPTQEIKLPKALRKFLAIKRYWDKMQNMSVAKILPGEFYVTVNNEAITTVLGSCISACIRDTKNGIGGMNHFMLPANKEDYGGMKKMEMTGANRYGNFAMESLINEILKAGGKKDRLEVKITGGGKIIQNMTNIGDMNIKFVEEYIKDEGLKLVASDVGDIYPRKVVYMPATGKVKVKRLRNMHNNTIYEREDKYFNDIKKEPVGGEVELF